MRECFSIRVGARIYGILELTGFRPEKEAGNKNNDKISNLIKPSERSGQQEGVYDFQLGHESCLWNFQVQMLNPEVRREI